MPFGIGTLFGRGKRREQQIAAAAAASALATTAEANHSVYNNVRQLMNTRISIHFLSMHVSLCPSCYCIGRVPNYLLR